MQPIKRTLVTLSLASALGAFAILPAWADEAPLADPVAEVVKVVDTIIAIPGRIIDELRK